MNQNTNEAGQIAINREAIAEAALQAYQLPDNVRCVNYRPWSSVDPSDLITFVNVFFDEQTDENPVKLAFHVRFTPEGVVQDVFALDMHGKRIGQRGDVTGLLVKDCINLELWQGLHPEIAAIDADSHVGRSVCVLLAQLQSVIETQIELEPEYVAQLKEMGICQARIWYFG